MSWALIYVVNHICFISTKTSRTVKQCNRWKINFVHMVIFSWSQLAPKFLHFFYRLKMKQNASNEHNVRSFLTQGVYLNNLTHYRIEFRLHDGLICLKAIRPLSRLMSPCRLMSMHGERNYFQGLQGWYLPGKNQLKGLVGKWEIGKKLGKT